MEKPAQPYEATQPVGNGQQVPDGLATIDEQSRQAAMARALVENEKRQREQRCGAEIQDAILKISQKHHCAVQFVETRINGNTVNVGIRAVAQDEQAT